MSNHKNPIQLERAQLLRDFIRAEILVALHSNGLNAHGGWHTEKSKNITAQADKLFNQIAGIE